MMIDVKDHLSALKANAQPLYTLGTKSSTNSVRPDNFTIIQNLNGAVANL
jgi:hypothetical protein